MPRAVQMPLIGELCRVLWLCFSLYNFLFSLKMRMIILVVFFFFNFLGFLYSHQRFIPKLFTVCVNHLSTFSYTLGFFLSFFLSLTSFLPSFFKKSHQEPSNVFPTRLADLWAGGTAANLGPCVTIILRIPLFFSWLESSCF